MWRLVRGALLIAALFISGGAQARMIESGIYYNASEPGRGYSIEQQGSQLTLIFYVYETSGAPVWYYANGGYTLNSSGFPTMSAAIGRYTGGQCLGCTFSSPTGTSVGNVTIAFSSPVTATLTLGSSGGAFGSGGSSAISLSRFNFTDATNPLLGQWAWAYSIGSTPTYANTWGGYVRFTTVGSVVNSGGTGYVSGSPSSYGGECYASGSLAGYCLVVQSSSSSFVEAYTIRWPVNEWRGTYQITTGTNTLYRVQGIRVGVNGESTAFGLGTAATTDLGTVAADGEPGEGVVAEAKILADRRGKGAFASPDPIAASPDLAPALLALAARMRAGQ